MRALLCIINLKLKHQRKPNTNNNKRNTRKLLHIKKIILTQPNNHKNINLSQLMSNIQPIQPKKLRPITLKSNKRRLKPNTKLLQSIIRPPKSIMRLLLSIMNPLLRLFLQTRLRMKWRRISMRRQHDLQLLLNILAYNHNLS